MKTKLSFIALLLSVGACQSYAQSGFDSSGNGMLNGTYYMRQVFYYYAPGQVNDLSATINIQGTISFSGLGSYTFSGTILDNTQVPLQVTTFNASGDYVISGSGEGYISAVDQSFPGDQIIGTVSHGVFVGSSIGNTAGYNDLFIAAPIGSTATNASLNGSYTVAYIDPTVPGDALFTMTADGQGNIGNVSATEYTGASTSATTQSLSGVTYSFSNGAATLKLGGTRNSSTLLAGQELLYISPDGNFIFGGNYNGYDMFVGVRAANNKPSNYAGLYTQAGLDLNESATSSGFAPLASYYGSFQALASGQIIGHQRGSSVSPKKYDSLSTLLIYGGSNDFTYFDSYTVNSDGSSDDSAFAQHYVSSTDGTIRIGYGLGPYLSLNVAFQAPGFSGSGVYLNPVGAVNAASSSPYTAQLSPGEFLTLYGTGLAGTTATASLPYQTTFQGVQVLVNQNPAPIQYVSPTQISIVVPYGTNPNAVAQIYVINNGTNSNLISAFTGLTSAGVFTEPSGGLGYAAALHPDYSVISAASPAQVGETVALYLTGMGVVTPRVADGARAPSNPLSYTTANPLVYLLDKSGNYKQALIGFSGLAPGFAGLYQINFTVPSGIVSGDATLEVIGTDSDTFQALLPVGSN